MRYLDDLVDDRKITGTPITPDEITQYENEIKYWMAAIGERPVRESSLTELAETIDRFKVPLWPWERLCQAMIYDLKHDGFRNFRAFLRYTEGAAIAPASIFTHLCGLQGDGQHGFRPPVYDVRYLARPLALFSYLVHIVRDFQKISREKNELRAELAKFTAISDEQMTEMRAELSDLMTVKASLEETNTALEVKEKELCEATEALATETKRVIAKDETVTFLRGERDASRDALAETKARAFAFLNPAREALMAERTAIDALSDFLNTLSGE